jgi:hypothetical protein
MKLDTRDTWLAVRELEATIDLTGLRDARALPVEANVFAFFGMQDLDPLIDLAPGVAKRPSRFSRWGICWAARCAKTAGSRGGSRGYVSEDLKMAPMRVRSRFDLDASTCFALETSDKLPDACLTAVLLNGRITPM